MVPEYQAERKNSFQNYEQPDVIFGNNQVITNLFKIKHTI
jgi:hypothetical protein